MNKAKDALNERTFFARSFIEPSRRNLLPSICCSILFSMIVAGSQDFRGAGICNNCACIENAPVRYGRRRTRRPRYLSDYRSNFGQNVPGFNSLYRICCISFSERSLLAATAVGMKLDIPCCGGLR